MAKRKSIHLGSKNFFTLVVLSVSALGLMTFTYASQQQTQTQSDASGNYPPCAQKPELKLDKIVPNPDFVEYKFIIINKDQKKSCKPDEYAITVDGERQGFTTDMTSDGKAIALYKEVSKGKPAELTIKIRPYGPNLKNKDYKMNVNLNHKIHNGPNSNVSKTIIYTKD